jgi:hypothetical protein
MRNRERLVGNEERIRATAERREGGRDILSAADLWPAADLRRVADLP